MSRTSIDGYTISTKSLGLDLCLRIHQLASATQCKPDIYLAEVVLTALEERGQSKHDLPYMDLDGLVSQWLDKHRTNRPPVFNCDYSMDEEVYEMPLNMRRTAGIGVME